MRSAPDRAETLPHAPQPAWDDLQDQAAVYSPARCTAGLTQRALIEQLVPVMARKRVQAGSGATPAPPHRLRAHRTSRHDVCGRGRSPRTTAALARWRPYTCGERLNQRWGAGRRRPSPTKSSRHRPTHEALQYLDVRSRRQQALRGKQARQQRCPRTGVFGSNAQARRQALPPARRRLHEYLDQQQLSACSHACTLCINSACAQLARCAQPDWTPSC